MILIENVEMSIWGREFSMPVEFERFAAGPVTETQIEVLHQFLAHTDWIVKAEKMVNDYCKKAVMDDRTNDKKENVFSYIKPHYLFVKQNREHPQIAIMCKYRYDMEHGLAIVFSHDGKITVGIQDIIL